MTIKKGAHHIHETGHANRHERDFRVTARRNKLLGLWAAEQMRLDGDLREAYAKTVVTADLAEPGDEDVIRKVLDDFAQHGVTITREQLRDKMGELHDEARRQLA